jgi:hypothetical protein
MANSQECLRRHGIHSHEEDTQDVRVYRPAGYDFPPVRGPRLRDGDMTLLGERFPQPGEHAGVPGRICLSCCSECWSSRYYGCRGATDYGGRPTPPC